MTDKLEQTGSTGAAHAQERPARGARTNAGWFTAALFRLHFYAGFFVGPFILVAALTGALYAATPTIERIIYDHELHTPVSGEALPLSEQVAAANAYLPGRELVLVRPAASPGDTTRVIYASTGGPDGFDTAVFIDPATTQVRGELTDYAGALPLRAWVSHVHRTLGLGEVGRLYSELAASWLWVVALAGLGLWLVRARRVRRRRRASADQRKSRESPRQRTLRQHTTIGLWALVAAVFLSATGITWSVYGGANVTAIRAAFQEETPSLDTALASEAAAAGGEHDGHDTSGGTDSSGIDLEHFDLVLAAARNAGIDAAEIEIVPGADATQAWAVYEVQTSFPTQWDSVAVDPATSEITDRVDFADYPLTAKLARWGIDLHMGLAFGIANQLILFLVAIGIAALVILGYRMWWKRRPTRRSGFPPPAPLRGTPAWVHLIIAGAIGIGILLPLFGITLAAFVIIDLAAAVLRRRVRELHSRKAS